ncbi:hypothetical protein ACJMK2_008023 [Sinanodonta woodiana]|uniref:Cytidine deaminase n=1 Tax=Sinanodonta woodiana TaxID=1069815 RepID=A0ABD3VKB7_SINWO
MHYKDLDSTIQKLIDLALEVKDKAYCPYSNFRVGCAVLCPDGSMFSGCNVENASYGLSMCAEQRVAVMKAVSEGHQKFKATAIVCDIKGSFKASCGACRQFYSEFGLDLEMYLVKPDMTVKKVILGDIFSMAFTPDALMEERI